jgi:hypothetical protein
MFTLVHYSLAAQEVIFHLTFQAFIQIFLILPYLSQQQLMEI